MEAGDREMGSMKLQTLQLLPDEQVATLRQQMVESQAAYQRKLQSSQEAQHRQAVLVQKLQGKVLQYRSWCRELQQRLEIERGGVLSYRSEAKEEHSLERALVQLEEEQQRCENLAEVNTLLREHLTKANEVNTALREDVRKLTADWTRARDELELKESEWRMEREFFDGYFRCEHDRLISLWRQVVTFRRHFLEMKTATDRDLSAMKADQIKLSGSILVSCFHLSSGTQYWESNILERSALRDQTQQLCARAQEMEKEVYLKTQEVMRLQVKGDVEKEELQLRVMELSALLAQSQKQNEEKEKTVKTLSDTMEILEASRLAVEYKASLIRDAKEETLSLHQVIKDITQAVLNDTDNAVSISWTERSQHPESSNLSLLLSSNDMERAVVLVHEALSRRCQAVQALKEQLSASQDSVHSLLHQQRQQEEESKMLRQRFQNLEENKKTLNSQMQHLQSLVETLSSDRVNLEKSREELQQQLKASEEEAWRLRRSNTELQLKEDLAQGEKEEQQLEMERILREREHL
uniref:Centrosomal protein 250 n=1 Tax=Pelodiscus sinensis TaxID=13735 RepID=K7FPY3_PELSI|nr:centrosome-associated protein CEP250 [Pelodiscus sinensis]XP_006111656.1 centrosome-associated protein CEP250 [Pelodiscus sinensis]XP_006111657.1 centrosome-associated protein CEP250 [Pelodiscus sinensis]XP_025041317.1 centrosome-associated protein CEP250 [Pelodiscus sinensis]|eukprot:XP_006111655.1 centrosome-associated protein CEP250 [Pelodiscus sinensis]